MERVDPSSSARDAVYRADTVLPSVQEVIGVQSSFSIHSDSETARDDATDGGSSSHDKFAHTRGKRKRTSREDFQVLEGEYQRNPRPDKATRAAIVARVSLSEKEVQIWFQNRRQMTRRKCRTWQPNEITSIIRLSEEQNTSSISGDQSMPEEEIQSTPVSQAAPSHDRGRSHSEAPSQQGLDMGEAEAGQVSSQPSSQLCATEPRSEQDTHSFRSQEESTQPADSQNKPDGVDASISSQARDDSPDKAEVPENGQESVDPAKPSKSVLKRKSSAVRLSLSFNGKAEVVLGSDSPSPPKKQALGESRVSRAGLLKRSQSAVSPVAGNEQPLGTDIPTWRRSRAPGRSRDARTWEFYCDSDARNALTKTAEHDQKGTAQAVLGLIRSGSNARKPLTPVRRENVPLQRTDSASSKKSAAGKVSRAKLSRSSSSLPRLQTVAALETARPRKTKLDKEVEIWQDNFGDSDKENQDPEDDGRRRQPSDFDDMPSSSRFLPPTAGDIASNDKENQIGEAGTSGTSHLLLKQGRGEEELDAVQNLLRLSQGEWC